MTPPVRPEQDPTAAIAALKAQGAPDEAIHAYLVSKGFQPVQQEPLVSRVAHGVVGAASQMVAHPLDTAAGMVKGAGSSLMDAVLSPGVGDARPDARLSKGGNASGRPIDTSPYDAAHGGITPGQRTAAGLQTVANLAFPTVAGGVAGKLGGGLLAKAAGVATASGLAGAAQSPDDPLAGGLTGAILGLGFGAAGKLGGSVGSKAIDIAGRPMESRPLIRSAPFLGSIEGITDRAARLNAPSLEKTPVLPNTMKPMAPVDRGIPAQRLARGLKTSSPAAETVLRDALTPRAEGAVQRVIDHGLELTGLKTREQGLGVVDDLIAQRAQHGRENFQPVFAAHPEPINNPELHAILNTPAGKQAAQRGATIAANRGQSIASTPELMGAPEGVSADDWANMQRMATERGMPLPEVPGAGKLAPTLEQAHHIKLGFDDMLQSAPEPGSGGSGPNNAAAIRQLKNRLLGVLDEHAPDYAAARKTFADESDLIRAGEVGRNLFKMHPQEAAKAFAEMPEAARDVARRTGFDALADRVENGPADVERGARKPRDVARMKLLFPDDAAFAKFQEGLKQEATMHATTQGTLGGSNTADKFADLAGMADVSLPDVFKAMKGNPLPLIAKGAKAMVSPRLREGAERLSAERARLLTAGADGTRTVQNSLSKGALVQAITGRPRGLPDGHDPTLPEVLDPSRGVNRQPPSAAVQSIRQQVDEMNRKQFAQAHHKKPF